MKRPNLVHFLAIRTDEFISIKASLSLIQSILYQEKKKGSAFPIQDVHLLESHEFEIKIEGLDTQNQKVFEKSYDSDNFGNFNFKIPLTGEAKNIEHLRIYEIKRYDGLELHLGSFILLKLEQQKKLIICDFWQDLGWHPILHHKRDVSIPYQSSKKLSHTGKKCLSS